MNEQDSARGGRLTALVLGAAAGGGFPQWNCRCANCAAYWAGEEGLVARTQSSLAVTSDGADWALLNASPDLRAQILATPELHPAKGRRHSPITSVLLTNGDLDHIAGLLTLREKQPFTLFATPEIFEVLAANPVFDALDRALVRFEPVALDAPFRLTLGITATLYATPGKVPLFMEGDGPVKTDQIGGHTVGVALQGASGRTLQYAPGCARMTPELAARLTDADAVLFDGTVFEDDEMIREGVGEKTGARMGHMAMAGPEGSLAAFRSLNPRRKIYIHINNTNPVLRPGSDERRLAEAEGWEIAEDGLVVEV